MNIVFVSNYFNHHQIPISEKLYELCVADGGTYCFMQTQEMEAERVKMGWGNELSQYPYLLNYWDNEANNQALIDSVELVIFGGTDDESYIQTRLSNKKIIWRYSERLYKTGRYKFISPRGLIRKFIDHTKHQFESVYLLCSGAYVAGDFRLVQAYTGKKYRYGYFPKCIKYDVDQLLEAKTYEKTGVISLLWAARMIDWKHPELPILLAKYLKDEGYSFTLTMIGGGELFDDIDKLVKDLQLDKYVSLLGFQSPSSTREYMERSDIFLATSDRQEGWGAVINEAMNSACVVVANRVMGAVPYLIKHEETGIVYRKLFSEKTLICIKKCMEDADLRKKLAMAAYHNIVDEWNEEVAATRLYHCMKATVQGSEIPDYEAGPLSKIKY